MTRDFKGYYDWNLSGFDEINANSGRFARTLRSKRRIWKSDFLARNHDFCLANGTCTCSTGILVIMHFELISVLGLTLSGGGGNIFINSVIKVIRNTLKEFKSDRVRDKY